MNNFILATDEILIVNQSVIVRIEEFSFVYEKPGQPIINAGNFPEKEQNFWQGISPGRKFQIIALDGWLRNAGGGGEEYWIVIILKARFTLNSGWRGPDRPSKAPYLIIFPSRRGKTMSYVKNNVTTRN